ncbi:Gfo/Idh/MocA family protein [Haloparvum sp. AD34]
MKVGIVGLGYWGSKVVGEYADLRDRGDIDAVVAIDEDPAQLGSLTNVDEKYQSVEKSLESVDALHVATSNSSHYPIAKMALESDVDVLVEKPLTTDRRLAFDLVEKASETGSILQTGHIFRFANSVRKLRDLYQDGFFGNVQYISLEWTHQVEPIKGTDVLWDLLPHPTDILNFVTGEWPETATGYAEGFRVDDNEAAFIPLRTDDLMANIHVSWVDPIRKREMKIVGSKRSARADCVEQNIQIFENEEESYGVKVEDNNTILAEAENFINSIETGENQFNSAIVGARAVDSIEQIVSEI